MIASTESDNSSLNIQHGDCASSLDMDKNGRKNKLPLSGSLTLDNEGKNLFSNKSGYVKLNHEECLILSDENSQLSKLIIPVKIMLNVEWTACEKGDKKSRFTLTTEAGNFIFSSRSFEDATKWVTTFQYCILQFQASQKDLNVKEETVLYTYDFFTDSHYDKKSFITLSKTQIHFYRTKINLERGLASWRLNLQLVSPKILQGNKLEICTPYKSITLAFEKDQDRNEFLQNLTNLSLDSHTQPTQDKEMFRSSLYSQPYNRNCADCMYEGKDNLPDWVALHFGVILCTECAGIHREIRRTDSISMDDRIWSSETSKDLIVSLGNKRCNEFWESNLSKFPQFSKPSFSFSKSERKKFIFTKYKQLKFASLITGTQAQLDDSLIQAIKDSNIIQVMVLLHSGANSLNEIPKLNNLSPLQYATNTNKLQIAELITLITEYKKSNAINWHDSSYLKPRPYWFKKAQTTNCYLDGFRVFHIDGNMEKFNLSETVLYQPNLQEENLNLLPLREDKTSLIIPYSSIVLIIEISSSNWGRTPDLKLNEWINSYFSLSPHVKFDPIKLQRFVKQKASIMNSTCVVTSECLTANNESNNGFFASDFSSTWYRRSEYLLFLKYDPDNDLDNEYEDKIFVLKMDPYHQTSSFIWIECFTKQFCPPNLATIAQNYEILHNQSITGSDSWTAKGWLVVRHGSNSEWIGYWAILFGPLLYLINPLTDQSTKIDVSFTPFDLKNNALFESNTNISMYDLRTMRGVEISQNIQPCKLSVKPRYPIIIMLPEVTLYVNSETNFAHYGWYKLFSEFLTPSGPGLECQILTQNHVPLGLEEALSYLDFYAVPNNEGLYRQCGVRKNIEKIYQNMVSNPRKLDFKTITTNPDDVCGAVKEFFKNLPEPITTLELKQEWAQALSLTDRNEKIESVKKILEKMPLINCATLRRIVIHLYGIAKNVDVTRMNVKQLTTAFSPSLFGAASNPTTSKEGDSENILHDFLMLNQAYVLFSFIIEEREAIFNITELEQNKENEKMTVAMALIGNSEENATSGRVRNKSALKLETNNQIHVPIIIEEDNGTNHESRAIIEIKTTCTDLLKNNLRLYFSIYEIIDLVVVEVIGNNHLQRPLSPETLVHRIAKSWNDLSEINRKDAHLKLVLKNNWAPSWLKELFSKNLPEFIHLNEKNRTYKVEYQTVDSLIKKEKSVFYSNSSMTAKNGLDFKKTFSKMLFTKISSTLIGKETSGLFDIGKLHLNLDENQLVLEDSSTNSIITWPAEHLGIFYGLPPDFISLKGPENGSARMLTFFIPRSALTIDQNRCEKNLKIAKYETLRVNTVETSLLKGCKSILENGYLGPTICFSCDEDLLDFLYKLNYIWNN